MEEADGEENEKKYNGLRENGHTQELVCEGGKSLDSDSSPENGTKKSSKIVRRRITAKTRPVPKPRTSLQCVKKPVTDSTDLVFKKQDAEFDERKSQDNSKPPSFRSRSTSYKQALDEDDKNEQEAMQENTNQEKESSPSIEKRGQPSTKQDQRDPEKPELNLLLNRDSNDNLLDGDKESHSPIAVRPTRKAPPPPKLNPVPVPRHKLHIASDDDENLSGSCDQLIIHRSASMDIPLPTDKAPAPPPSPDIICTSSKPPRPERPHSIHFDGSRKKIGQRPPEDSLDDEEYLLPLDKKEETKITSPGEPSPASITDMSPSTEVQLPTKKPQSKRRSLTTFLVSVKDSISGISNPSSRKSTSSTGRSPDQQATFYYSTVQLEDIAKSIELSRKMDESSVYPNVVRIANSTSTTTPYSRNPVPGGMDTASPVSKNVANLHGHVISPATAVPTTKPAPVDGLDKTTAVLKHSATANTNTKRQGPPIARKPAPRNLKNTAPVTSNARSATTTNIQGIPTSAVRTGGTSNSNTPVNSNVIPVLNKPGAATSNVQSAENVDPNPQVLKNATPKLMTDIKNRTPGALPKNNIADEHDLPVAPPRLKKKHAAEHVKPGTYACMSNSASQGTGGQENICDNKMQTTIHESEHDESDEYIYPDITTTV